MLPSAHNSQVCARPKPGDSNSIQSLIWAAGSQALILNHQLLPPKHSSRKRSWKCWQGSTPHIHERTWVSQLNSRHHNAVPGFFDVVKCSYTSSTPWALPPFCPLFLLSHFPHNSHPFTCWKTLLMFPGLGNFEWSHYKQMHARCNMNISFHSSWKSS